MQRPSKVRLFYGVVLHEPCFKKLEKELDGQSTSRTVLQLGERTPDMGMCKVAFHPVVSYLGRNGAKVLPNDSIESNERFLE